jgi:hypothetical protein
MKRMTKPFIIGRDAFAKISAVEGVRLTPAMRKDFESFDAKSLSPSARRAALIEKYGTVR